MHANCDGKFVGASFVSDARAIYKPRSKQLQHAIVNGEKKKKRENEKEEET
jgi:hypothetical protein